MRFSLRNVVTVLGVLSALTSGLYAAAPVMGPGNAVYVNSEYFESNLNLNTLDTMTVSLWVKRTAGFSSWSAVISNDNGGYDKALMFYNNDYHIFAGTNISTGVSSVLDAWEFITMVMTPDDIKFYKNGVLEYDRGSGYAGTEGSSNTGIFASASGSYSIGGVFVDEFRVWNTELSEAEVMNNMHRTLAGDEAGLVSYYRFDDISGGSFSDASGSGYNSVASNFEGDEASTSDIYTPWPVLEEDTLTSIAAYDPDDDSLTLVELTAPDNGSVTFDNAAGTFTYIPNADFQGADSFVYSATDTTGAADTLQVLVGVQNVPDPVAITSGTVDTASEGSLYEYVVTLNDPDGDAVVSIQSGPAWLSVSGDTVRGTPGYHDEGSAPFTLIASNAEYADTLTVALAVLNVPEPLAEWNGDGYSYRKKIVFDNTSYNEDLAEFPVLIMLDASRIDFGAVADDGSDLLFVDAYGSTALSHEVQQWDEAGTCLVWVNVPQIDRASDYDHIWMYYGNDDASAGADPAGTWNAAYEGVWHMDDATTDEGNGESVADVTANGADGTHYGVSAGPGVFASGQYFGRSDGAQYYDYITMPNSVLNGKTDVTSSFWLKTTHTAAQGLISGAENSSYNNEYLLFMSNNTTLSVYHSSVAVSFTVNSISDGLWHHYTVVTDAVNDEVCLYVDGVPDDENPIALSMGTLTIAAGGLMLGQDQDAVGGNLDLNQALEGTMDELRIASAVRSADWIAAQYASMTGGFIMWDSAAVEANPDSLPPDNDLVLSAALVAGTDKIALAWNPGSVDSADACEVGIWYREGTPPTTPGDISAAMWNSYTMAESTDTVSGLPKGEYYFMATVRDSQNNAADTTSAARDSAVVPNHSPLAGLGGGNALDFGGSDEYVAFNDVAPAMAGASDFTLEFWLKADISAQNATYGAGLISINTGTGGNTMLIRMDAATGRLEFGSDYGAGIGDDAWHHVVLTRDGTDVAIYIDGFLEGTTTSTATFNADDRWSLGQEWDTDATSDHLIGQMDHVRVWSVTRTQSEIRAYMYRPVSGEEAGLEAAFDMDHASGDALTDLTGNGYDGILYNMEDGDWITSTSWDVPVILEDGELVISAGSDPDGDNDSLTITELAAPANGVLALDNGEVTVTYVPDTDYNGVDTFAVVITDDEAVSDTMQVFVVVTAVNDEPTFAVGINDTVDEDAGAQAVAGWASGIIAGPADEAGQTLVFVVGNDNNDLFATQPAVDEVSGDLTYEPVPDAFGEAEVVVYLTDDGGTIGEGDDRSSPDTFMIVVSALADDAPVAGSGTALSFDGIDDNAYAVDDASLNFGTGAFTLEAWIRNDNTPGSTWKRIITKRGVSASGWYSLVINGQLTLELAGGDNVSAGPAIQGDGLWHHVAATRDGSGNISLYVDGTEYDGYSSMQNVDNSDTLEIGKWLTEAYNGETFLGDMDEIRIWNIERTASEITAGMYEPLSGIETGLVAYYRFDETSGSDLPDISGNNNSGMLENMDDTDWIPSKAWQVRDVDENNTLVVAAGYDTDNDTLAITEQTGPANGSLVIDDQTLTLAYIPDADWFGTDTFSYYLTDTVSVDSFDVYVTVNTTNQSPVGTGDHTGLTFDGVNDYMDFDVVADDLAGVTTLCFEFWMKADLASFPEATGHHFSVNTGSGGNTFLIGCIKSTGQLNATGGLVSTTNAVTGEWLHYAYVRDGGMSYLYINGELEDTGTATYTLLSSDNWSLGMELDSSNPSNEYAGEMDEVRVWHTARSQAEIQDNMHIELAGTEAGLTGYWRLDDGSGTVAEDASGNGNDGLLLYDADWTTTGRPVFVGYPSIDEDDTMHTVSLGSDPDGDTVVVAELNNGSNGTTVLDAAALTVTYIPDTDWNGTDTLAYELTDPEGLVDTMTFVIAVDPVADPVTITSAAVDTAQETMFYAYQVTLDDIDGDAVISLENAPGWMILSVDSAGGMVPYVHERDTVFTIIAANGTYADTVTVALAIKDTNGTVPVELSSFTASAVNGDVVLKWTTETETDNLGFNVLKAVSVDGPFEQVNGALIPGAGTTTLPQSYVFMDTDVAAGACYYVLEQVDVGGAVSLSDVVTVDVTNGIYGSGGTPDMHLYPVMQYNLDGTVIPAGAALQPGVYIKVLDGAAVKVWVAE